MEYKYRVGDIVRLRTNTKLNSYYNLMGMTNDDLFSRNEWTIHLIEDCHGEPRFTLWSNTIELEAWLDEIDFLRDRKIDIILD